MFRGGGETPGKLGGHGSPLLMTANHRRHPGLLAFSAAVENLLRASLASHAEETGSAPNGTRSYDRPSRTVIYTLQAGPDKESRTLLRT